MTWEFFDYCLNNRIVPFCLPPHSTHLLQPLDVGLFSPLQKHYSNVLDESMEDSGGDTGINKGTFLQYLFEARRRAYTSQNILSAWAKAGIVPFNPRRVLNPVASPVKKSGFLVSGPTTPRNTRMARSTAKEALALVRGGSASAQKLRDLIHQLDKGLQISLTEKDIGDHINAQFRKSVAKKGRTATNDRKQLSKARVITTEDVARLREQREAADIKKAAQVLARDLKKKVKEEPKKKVKKVSIPENITVHTIDIKETGLGVVEESEEDWSNIEEFPTSPPLLASRRSSRLRK